MSSPIPKAVFENHTGILGKTGSGKTVTAKLMAEDLLQKKNRICAVDPTGVWWGLKSSADGKKAGYPIVVFGGRNADLPLNENHGAALAEIIGTSAISAVVDTSLMTVGQRTRFFTDFAETLLRKNENPLHLFLDEAHVFAPQGKVPNPQSGIMLHAANNLVSLGRSRGLRIVMISQRPAKLHKDSLTQVETLIAMRLIAPQDRDAVKAWIGEWDSEGRGKDIINSLPSLSTGEGWLWAPEIEFLKLIKFPMIKTFDSSAAPKNGEEQKVVLASIDLPTIEGKLQEISVDIMSDDPRHLKKQIAELNATIKKLEAQKPAGIDRQQAEKLKQTSLESGILLGRTEALDDAIQAMRQLKKTKPDTTIVAHVNPPEAMKNPKTAEAIHTIAKAAVNHIKTHQNSYEIGRCEGAILNVLAQFPQGRTKNQISILSGYSSKSGGFNNSLSKLRTKGLIQGSGVIKITQDGQALAVVDPLPQGQELLNYWVRKLGKCEGAILGYLFSIYPSAPTKNLIGEATGYSPTSGGFNNSLSKLRTLELIEGRGEIICSDNFFQETA